MPETPRRADSRNARPLAKGLALLGPAVAALVVTAVLWGRAGVRDLLARMARWRIPLRWWVATLSPLAFFGVGLAVASASGKLPRGATSAATAAYRGFAPLAYVGFVFGLACSIVLTWLYNRTGGSILACAVWHGLFNLATGAAAAASSGTIQGVTSAFIYVQALLIAGLELRARSHGGTSILGPRRSDVPPSE